MAGGGGQTSVARQQWCVERFGQSDIGSVISRQIVPQRPNAGQKEIMRISYQGKVRQVRERHATALAVDFAIRGVAPDNLSNFHIEQMRRMERLMRREQAIFHEFRCLRAEKCFKQR